MEEAFKSVRRTGQSFVRGASALLWGAPPVWLRLPNRAMTLFTSLGPPADCMGLTQVTKYQVRTGYAGVAALSVSQRDFLLGWS